MVILVYLFSMPSLYAASASKDVAEGNKFYHQKKFPEARLRYEAAAVKAPSESKIDYNIGTAAYRSGNFDAAVEHFQKSLLTDDEHFRRDAYYNLGNAMYQAGISLENKDISQAIERVDGALKSFEKGLLLDPSDAEAAHNRDFIKNEIERLKQKKQEMQNQSRQESKNADKEHTDKSSAANNSSQPGQSQKDQSSQEKNEEKQDASTKKDQSEGGKEEKPASDQMKGDKSSSGVKNTAPGQADSKQILSEKEANDLIDDFERNELPKGSLNFTHQVKEEKPVGKDW